MKHPYANILIAIANGENIQIQHYDNRVEWDNVDHQTALSHIYSNKGVGSIRIKPRVILINGHEVPEPLKVDLKHDDVYFCPSFHKEDLYEIACWTDDQIDINRLNNAVIHSTKEAAIKHAEALISFTKVNKE